ncbi:MAG: glycosyltransferase family 4 protein [Gemmatimonadaceae bacterium]
MHVLFLTHAFPRYAGDAAGSFLLRLATALRGEGVTVAVLAPHAPGYAEREPIDGIVVRRFRYAPDKLETLAYTGTMVEQVRTSWGARLALGGLLAAELRAALAAARELRPDVIHAHWWFPSGLAALPLSGRQPLVTTLHGTDVRLARASDLARPLFRQVLARSARTTAVSRWLAAETHAVAPALPAPLVARMPVAAELFSPGSARTRDCLLFVGRLNRQKGLELLLRALPLMRARASLDVVGDGEDAAALRALSASLGLRERVRWHGAVPQPALADFYRAATALVVPSLHEGLGLVAAEAQLCETPVVACDSGGLPDLVDHGRTGILVPPADAERLAAALDDLLGREDRGRALGVAGRQHALATFAPGAVARQYADIYRAALATRARRGAA